MLSIWQVLPGIGVAQPPTSRVENGIETGHKHHRWDFCIEEIVDLCQCFAWRDCLLSNGAEHGVGRRHHQSSWHSFIGDIADDNPYAAIFKRKEIVEVAADLSRWPVIRCYLPAWKKRNIFRQE